jgi:hypothetical protein
MAAHGMLDGSVLAARAQSLPVDSRSQKLLEGRIERLALQR